MADHLERRLLQLSWESPPSVIARSRLSHIIRRGQTQIDKYYWLQLPTNIDEWQINVPLPTPSEQLDNMILWLGDHQTSYASSAVINIPEVAAWIGAPITRNHGEAGFGWLLEQESTSDLVENRGEQASQRLLRLKMKGWARYQALKHAYVVSRRALMAMDFKNPELDRVVEECFAPAVERAGFQLRVLRTGQPAGLIDDQLRVALRTSRFVVADLTDGNNGAYWESGFAEGLGRPVIYTCREKEWKKQKSHFDTNHLVTIVWNVADLEAAGKNLTATIRATMPEEAKMTDD
jgi:hypothetical protein